MISGNARGSVPVVAILVPIVLHLFPAKTEGQSDGKELQYEPIGNYFPSCVDLMDVYPHQRSVLRSVGVAGRYTLYSIQVTFSKPVKVDEIARLRFVLTPLLTAGNLTIAAHKVGSWRGSERSIFLLFYINHFRLNISKVYLVLRYAESKELVPSPASRGLFNVGNRYCEYFKPRVKCFPSTLKNLILVTAVIGEYYLSGGLNLLEHQIPRPQLVQPNPFCFIQRKRSLYFLANSEVSIVRNMHSQVSGHGQGANVTELLPEVDVFNVNIVEAIDKTYVYVPVVLKRRGSQFVQLPPFLNATSNAHGSKIMVKFTKYKGVQIEHYQETTQKKGFKKLYIPVEVLDVYEIKEKIVAKHEYRYYGEIPWLVRKKYNDAINVSILCLPNSTRNPSHLNHLSRHMIEYGPLYHIIVPHPISEWKDEYTSIEHLVAFQANKSDNIGSEMEVIVDKKSPIARRIETALKKYVCLLPSTSDLSYANVSDSSGNTWIHMDKCIFVPFNVAFSSDCGGLQLFRNLSSVFQNDSNFCHTKFGDCIGMPFSSTIRFPPIPTYGLQELTGFFPCGTCNDISKKQEHPYGKLYYKYTKDKAYPRSVLRYRYTWKTDNFLLPHKEVHSATLILLPEYETDNVNLILKIGTDFATILYPKLAVINEGSAKGCGYMLLNIKESLFSTTVNFTVEVFNSGEKSHVPVTFQLNSNTVKSIAKFVHCCNVTIRIPRYKDTDIRIACPRCINTYYGLFQDPCFTKATQIPMNLIYYILPSSDASTIKLLQKVKASSFGKDYTYLRGISVYSQLYSEETRTQISASRSHSVYIYCGNKDIVVIPGDSLALLSTSHYKASNDLLFDIEESTKQVYFFLSIPASKEGASALTFCSLKLTANLPNGYCAKDRVTLKEMFIPFSSVDIPAAMNKKRKFFYKRYNMEFLKVLYGWQSFDTFFSMIVCVFASVLLIVFLATGYGFKHYFSSKFPKIIILSYFKIMLKDAIDANESYWADPNSFLQPSPPNSPHGPYFVLYDFKSALPFDTKNLSTFKLAGVLRYKDKELSVVVGDIHHIFIEKKRKSTSLWLHTASGVYLLMIKNCSPEYQQEMYRFLERIFGVKEF